MRSNAPLCLFQVQSSRTGAPPRGRRHRALCAALPHSVCHSGVALHRSELARRAVLSPTGRVESWDLSKLRIKHLPGSFGRLHIEHNLNLNRNKLRTLPEEFSQLTVGGTLFLSQNQLSTLPESFGSLTLGGELQLSGNQLLSLPASFGSLRLGGFLGLGGNLLEELPENFGKLPFESEMRLVREPPCLPPGELCQPRRRGEGYSSR